jgi:hypothetical protein
MTEIIAWVQANWMIVMLALLVWLEVTILMAWYSHKHPPSLDLPWRHW